MRSAPTLNWEGTPPLISDMPYDASVPLLLSEIDPVQNAAADNIFPGGPNAVVNAGFASFSETAKWTPACGAAHTCYPAAVNYTPLYYLINGVSFNKDNPTLSEMAVAGTASTGNVLLHFVNAGLRMHVPSVEGANMSLIAEDGNVLPDVVLAAAKAAPTGFTSPPLNARVQSDLFLPAGKVFDVVINPIGNATATAGPTLFTAGTYPVYDRELSLSTNNQRNGGMYAYLLVNGGGVAAAGGGTGGGTGFAAPAALSATPNADIYYCAPGILGGR